MINWTPSRIFIQRAETADKKLFKAKQLIHDNDTVSKISSSPPPTCGNIYTSERTDTKYKQIDKPSWGWLSPDKSWWSRKNKSYQWPMKNEHAYIAQTHSQHNKWDKFKTHISKIKSNNPSLENTLATMTESKRQ